MPEMCGGLPTPPVPAVALSGLAFSQAISPLRSLAGRSLRLTSSSGPVTISAIGAKSARRSYCKRIGRAVQHVMAPLADAQRVAVGRGRATLPTPIEPPAPATLSTRTVPAEVGGHALGEHAGDGVGRSAGRGRHDHGDGTRRLRSGPRRPARATRSARDHKPSATAGSLSSPARQLYGSGQRVVHCAAQAVDDLVDLAAVTMKGGASST